MPFGNFNFGPMAGFWQPRFPGTYDDNFAPPMPIPVGGGLSDLPAIQPPGTVIFRGAPGSKMNFMKRQSSTGPQYSQIVPGQPQQPWFSMDDARTEFPSFYDALSGERQKSIPVRSPAMPSPTNALDKAIRGGMNRRPIGPDPGGMNRRPIGPDPGLMSNLDALIQGALMGATPGEMFPVSGPRDTPYGTLPPAMAPGHGPDYGIAQALANAKAMHLGNAMNAEAQLEGHLAQAEAQRYAADVGADAAKTRFLKEFDPRRFNYQAILEKYQKESEDKNIGEEAALNNMQLRLDRIGRVPANVWDKMAGLETMSPPPGSRFPVPWSPLSGASGPYGPYRPPLPATPIGGQAGAVATPPVGEQARRPDAVTNAIKSGLADGAGTPSGILDPEAAEKLRSLATRVSPSGTMNAKALADAVSRNQLMFTRPEVVERFNNMLRQQGVSNPFMARNDLRRILVQAALDAGKLKLQLEKGSLGSAGAAGPANIPGNTMPDLPTLKLGGLTISPTYESKTDWLGNPYFAMTGFNTLSPNMGDVWLERKGFDFNDPSWLRNVSPWANNPDVYRQVRENEMNALSNYLNLSEVPLFR